MTMPTTGFNIPRGSFPTPIKPIGVGPLEGPLVEARFNYQWCSVIVGCLSQLLLNTTWDVSSQAELTAIQENVFDLMSAFCYNPPKAGVVPSTGTDGGDDFMLRQNPDNPCELQTSVDGVNWCTWADLSKCQPNVTQQAGGTPQPTPGGGCQTYHVILPANGKYLLPAPVNPGDTLEISNLKGASNDGTLSPWYCGDGNLYFAGGCFGSSTLQSGDPLPAYAHLALIAEAGGLFFPVLGGVIAVGAVGAYQNLMFQVNDSILSDNQGSLEFDVKICNEQAASWSHTFDFTLSDGGWFLKPFSGLTTGVWTPGTGWVATDTTTGSNHEREVYIERDFAATITRVQANVSWTPGSGFPGGDQAFDLSDNTGSILNRTNAAMPGTGASVLLDTGGISRTVTRLVLDLTSDFEVSGTPLGGTAIVKSVTVSGTGTNPF